MLSILSDFFVNLAQVVDRLDQRRLAGLGRDRDQLPDRRRHPGDDAGHRDADPHLDGAQGYRPHPEPHRAQPGRPLGHLPGDCRRRQDVDQGRHRPRPSRQAGLQPGADPDRRRGMPDLGRDPLRSRHDRPGSQHRRAVYRCDRLDQHRCRADGRLVLQQQVRPDRRLPCGGPAAQLRSADGAFDRDGGAAGRLDAHDADRRSADPALWQFHWS